MKKIIAITVLGLINGGFLLMIYLSGKMDTFLYALGWIVLLFGIFGMVLWAVDVLHSNE